MDATLAGKAKMESAQDGLLSEIIDEGNSSDGDNSNDSEFFRESAERIL